MRKTRAHWWLLVAAFGVLFAVAALSAVAYSYRESRLAAPAQPARRRHRGWLPVAAIAVVLLAVAVVGGAYAYDASRGDVIASGVRVGPVSVGGLTRAAAARKVERAYEALYRPLLLRSEGRRFRLYPLRAGVTVHVEGAVSRAVARSRGGWFLPRAVRGLVGKDLDAAVAPRITFSRVVVAQFADRVEGALERPPRPAAVLPRADRLVVRRAAAGVDVDGVTLRRRIVRALTTIGAARSVAVPMSRTPARVTTADLARRYPAFITVDRANFQLRVYEHLTLARTYSIAVGQIGLETPAGLYHIQNKVIDPSWAVPNSAWAGSLAGSVIPPGPGNPLQARWLGIFDGAGIHGTADMWSLGSAASHGCIRMAVADVIDLYDRVDVGTPIYIG